MKKVLMFIFAFLLVFTLVGCDDAKLTLKFETNGGTEVASREVKITEITSFKLSDVQAPTKDGFNFIGWYTNVDCSEEFKNDFLTNKEGTITLYAKWEEIAVDKLVVSFETNGGSEMENQKVKLEEASSFDITKVAAPTKEGYIFLGWYADAEFTKAFSAQELEGKSNNDVVKAYAKWEAEPVYFSGKYSTDFNADVTYNDMQVKANIKFAVETAFKDLNTEDIEKLDGTLTLKLNVTCDEAAKTLLPVEAQAFLGQDIMVSLYAKDGFLTCKLPAFVGALVIPGFTGTEFSVKFDMKKVADEAVVTVKELMDSMTAENPENPIEMDALLEKVQNLFNLVVGKLLESCPTIIEDAKTLISIMKPVEKVEGDKTTYTITDIQFKTFLASVPGFVNKYLTNLILLGNQMEDLIAQVGLDELMPGDVKSKNPFDADKGGWVDAEGTFHSFAEDKETQNYGYVLLNRFYVCYALDYVFYDLNDNCKKMEGYVTYNGYTLYGQDGYYYYVYESDSFEYHPFEDDLENGSFGYYDETEGTYQSYDGRTYAVKDGKLTLMTELELAQKAAEKISSMISMILPMVSGMITLNKVEVSETKAAEATLPSQTTFDFDVLVNLPAGMAGEEAVKVAVKLSLVQNLEYSLELPTYEHPVLEAMDLTDTIIEGLKSLLEQNPDSPAK